MSKFIDRLSLALKGKVENLVNFTEIDSTHALTLRLMEQMDQEEMELPTTLFLAGGQSQGRGRRQRTWCSPPGGLYFSWVRSGISQSNIGRLPMLAAAASHSAVSSLGITAKIKWPNDILVQGKKLAGLLIHARHGDSAWAVISCGINLTTTPHIDDLDGLPATSVAAELACAQWDEWALKLVTTIVSEIHLNLTHPEPALAMWREHLVHRPGEPVSVRFASGEVVTGDFAGLTAEGFLRLTQGPDERVISTGDVVETGKSE